MNTKKIKLVIVLGLFAIIGIILLQSIFFKQAFDLEKKKFSQKVHIALLEVVKNLSRFNNNKIPISNPVRQVSEDYYVINVNYDINAEVLDVYLKNEFKKIQIHDEYEYAIYDCETDNMVYGNYVTNNQESNFNPEYFPKFDPLVYYFAVRFPSKSNYLFTSLNTWILLSAILLSILIIYVYSIFVILRQKKYSELQKDFINNMTHEFKTPLSSILIASNYLSKQPAIKESEKLNMYAKTIISQSKRLNKNVEQVLNLAKTENNPLVLTKNKINLNKVINLAVNTFKVKPNNNVSFRIYDFNKEYFISADEIHFTNVLNNIIENSIKYAENDPEIAIKIDEQKNNYILEIEDNGKGISKKNLKHIFKKFFRVPQNNKDHVNGFGLGLYYVKNICDLHGWKINILSTPDEGTNFQIVLPKFEYDA